MFHFKLLLSGLLAVFIFQEAQAQLLRPLPPKRASEDILGFLGRSQARTPVRKDMVPHDGLTWKEREENYGFTTSGLDSQLPLVYLKRPYREYFVEQKTESSYDEIYGLAEEIRQAAMDTVFLTFSRAAITTPEEIHRELCKLAVKASSDDCISEEFGDYRFRFHAEFARVNDARGAFGPRFNFDTKKYEGKLDKTKPIYTGVTFVLEFINPQTQALMKAINDPESMPAELVALNGPEPDWKIASHLLPDSYFTTQVQTSLTQSEVKFEQREKYTIDINRAVVVQNIDGYDEFLRGLNRNKKYSFTKNAIGKEREDVEAWIKQFRDVAFLLPIENNRTYQCEYVWVNNIEATLSGLTGTINNSPVLVKGYSKGDRIDFHPSSVADVVYLENDSVRYGDSIFRHIRLLSESDSRKITHMSRVKLD